MRPGAQNTFEAGDKAALDAVRQAKFANDRP
jgi:hypothetical protein